MAIERDKPIVATEIADALNKKADLGKALTVNLLWTNASPTSVFNPQTISLDLSNYKIILISFYDAITLRMIRTYISLKKEADSVFTMFTPVALIERHITVDNTGITLGDALAYRMYNNEVEGLDRSNNFLIPHQVYGVR